jgi:DNA-binding MarR family transcriptional regulator
MTSDCREPVMRTWTSLLMARRRVLDAVAAELKAEGLPPLNVCLVLILLAMEREGRLRPIELEELERRLETAQYTMSRLLDRMEKSGLIQRQPCPADGRSHHISLTPEGRRMFDAVWPVYCAAIERHLGGGLCEVSAGTLADLLDRIGRDRRKAGIEPLPLDADRTYIATAARKDGYGDKRTSE